MGQDPRRCHAGRKLSTKIAPRRDCIPTISAAESARSTSCGRKERRRSGTVGLLGPSMKKHGISSSTSSGLRRQSSLLHTHTGTTGPSPIMPPTWRPAPKDRRPALVEKTMDTRDLLRTGKSPCRQRLDNSEPGCGHGAACADKGSCAARRAVLTAPTTATGSQLIGWAYYYKPWTAAPAPDPALKPAHRLHRTNPEKMGESSGGCAGVAAVKSTLSPVPNPLFLQIDEELLQFAVMAICLLKSALNYHGWRREAGTLV